jgi:hypothetical protein
MSEIYVGMKLKWNGRTWVVAAWRGGAHPSGGRVRLETEGLPPQSVDWLVLAGWLDDGRAIRVKE